MRQLSKASEEQDAFGNSNLKPEDMVPEISKDILKNLVVDSKTGIEDKQLFMMFCGVDCLQNLQPDGKSAAERAQAESAVQYNKAVDFLHEGVVKKQRELKEKLEADAHAKRKE
jgi:hypothetical protein